MSVFFPGLSAFLYRDGPETEPRPEHHDKIGGFPRKGALLHYHYAKLILYSHVFRGPRDTPTIPPHFLDSAVSNFLCSASLPLPPSPTTYLFRGYMLTSRTKELCGSRGH